MTKSNCFKILAIDTSCDDTAVAILDQDLNVLSNVVSSQVNLHQPYGGVFPTVAKLAHQENIDWCIKLALKKAQLDWPKLSALAVTVGPGLAPALEVGLKKTSELSLKYGLPIITVNHVEAHAWSSLLKATSRQFSTSSINSSPTPLGGIISSLNDKKATLPLLALVASGGHSEFIFISQPGEYEILGQTLDDAAGECLDKIGRLFNLGYPAGATIEQLAKLGNPQAYPFPLPLTTRKDYDLSFSGLKTYARNLTQDLIDKNQNQPLSAQTIYDLCASTQKGVFRHLIYKLNKLLLHLQDTQPPHLFPQTLLLGGGVAANIEFRRQLRTHLKKSFPHLTLSAPLKKYCGDNAAMIGLIACLKYPFANSSHPHLFSTSTQLDRQPSLKVNSWF